MRMTKKDKAYFDSFIAIAEESYQKRLHKLASGTIKSDRIISVKNAMSWTNLTKLIAKYTRGDAIQGLIDDYLVSVDLMSSSWIDNTLKESKNGIITEYNQYPLSTYNEMLWMLSIGYLLNVNEEDYKKLVEIIDKDKVVDRLYEFIISAKIHGRESQGGESYEKYLGIPESYYVIRKAIVELGISSSTLIKEFLTSHWYDLHKNTGWYNSHEKNYMNFFGYWSFESAALTCIMGLDDRGYRDQQYYPKDLVDYYYAVQAL